MNPKENNSISDEEQEYLLNLALKANRLVDILGRPLERFGSFVLIRGIEELELAQNPERRPFKDLRRTHGRFVKIRGDFDVDVNHGSDIISQVLNDILKTIRCEWVCERRRGSNARSERKNVKVDSSADKVAPEVNSYLLSRGILGYAIPRTIPTIWGENLKIGIDLITRRLRPLQGELHSAAKTNSDEEQTFTQAEIAKKCGWEKRTIRGKLLKELGEADIRPGGSAKYRWKASNQNLILFLEKHGPLKCPVDGKQIDSAP